MFWSLPLCRHLCEGRYHKMWSVEIHDCHCLLVGHMIMMICYKIFTRTTVYKIMKLAVAGQSNNFREHFGTDCILNSLVMSLAAAPKIFFYCSQCLAFKSQLAQLAALWGFGIYGYRMKAGCQMWEMLLPCKSCQGVVGCDCFIDPRTWMNG